MNNTGIIGGLISLIVMSFVIAMCYGLFLTTMDFTRPNYDPVASGHRAAANIYGLFGTVSTEVKDNETQPEHPTTTARKIATPYAVTADISAILGGKLEQSMASILHAVGLRTNGGNPTGGSPATS